MAKSNLIQRVLAAAVFGPVLVVLFWLGNHWLFVMWCGVICIGTWEFYRMLSQKGLQPWTGFGIVISLSWCAVAFFVGPNAFAFFFLVLLLLMFSIALCRDTAGYRMLNAGGTLLGVLYVGFLGSFVLIVRNSLPVGASEQGQVAVLILLGIWANDTMAYFFGRWFGRRHPFPTISAAKTEAGFIGGLLSALLVTGLGGQVLGLFNIAQSLILGLLIGIGASLGDLVESMIKRDMDVKDTSELIPGHGGILDRFDSTFFVFPLIYLYFQVASNQ